MNNITIRPGVPPCTELRPGPARNVLDLGNTIPVPVKDYEALEHKPRLNGVELFGDKCTRELKIEITDPLSNLDIENMLSQVFPEGGQTP